MASAMERQGARDSDSEREVLALAQSHYRHELFMAAVHLFLGPFLLVVAGLGVYFAAVGATSPTILHWLVLSLFLAHFGAGSVLAARRWPRALRGLKLLAADPSEGLAYWESDHWERRRSWKDWVFLR
jgi:hypothetical protein